MTSQKRNSPKVIIYLLLVLFIGFGFAAYYLVENTSVKYVPEFVDIVVDKIGKRFYFENPSDTVLKKGFKNSKRSYEKLCQMMAEDNILKLDESQIKYEGSNAKAEFMPGLSDNLKGKVNRRRFYTYHELLTDCKVRTIDRVVKADDEESAPFVRFLLYTDQEITNLNRPFTEKYIVWFERDNFTTVADTDKVQPDKDGLVNVMSKIEPHWYIWKCIYKAEDGLHF